jgi:hypothetical protein
MKYKKNRPNEAKLEDFPSNDEEGSNWLRLRRPDGNTTIELDRLQLLKSFVVTKDGQPAPGPGRFEAMVKLIPSHILEWSFADPDTGFVYPITEENLRTMEPDDFNYVVIEFSNLLGGTVGRKAQEQAEKNAGKPKAGLTENEKNGSAPGSGQENLLSEAGALQLTRLPEVPQSADGMFQTFTGPAMTSQTEEAPSVESSTMPSLPPTESSPGLRLLEPLSGPAPIVYPSEDARTVETSPLPS